MKLQGLLSVSLITLLTAYPAMNTLANTSKAPIRDLKGMAHPVMEESSGFEGWSLGAGVGVNSFAMNSTITTTASTTTSPFLSGIPGNVFNSNARANVYQFGPMGKLFAGYGYMRDIYYAGVDAGVNFLGANNLNSNQTSVTSLNSTSSGATLSVVTSNNTITTQTKLRRGWAEPFLDLKLGGLITPQTLSYARIGTSYNRYTMTSNTNFASNGTVALFGPLLATPSASTNSNLYYQQTKYLFGLRLGAGIETMLMRHFSIAADYIYSFYPNFNTNRTANTSIAVCDAASGCAITPGIVNNKTSTSMSDQQVMASFIYHIN